LRYIETEVLGFLDTVGIGHGLHSACAREGRTL
jgi:hypothetical protein